MALPAGIKVTRKGPGNYYYFREANPDRCVAVFTREGNPEYGDPAVMWIAAAEWSGSIYGDPVRTKREAVETAVAFLTEAWANSDVA